MGLAIQSTLEKGFGSTTLEFKISLVRAITPDTGEIRAEGKVLNGGCVKKTRKRHAVREMEVDPSKPLCRKRLQTAMSCFGQKPRW
jgi:acyl-coenzyme A thioesterase PaaI-like protein